VEAGLRTHTIYNPWPEEINRQITSRIAACHFAPTPLSRQNLLAEGIDAGSITVTGNTVIDALDFVTKKITDDAHLRKQLEEQLLSAGYDSRRLRDGKRLVLITGHRRENLGEGFINICNAIKTLAAKYPCADFVYPVHPNPGVRSAIREIFGETAMERRNTQAANSFFIEPLEYLPFVFLMQQSFLVLTDSGGIQEEAPGLGKPVLVMRSTTERPEALEAGTVKLVGTDYDLIVSEVSRLLDDGSSYAAMAQANNPYGNGKACECIVNTLLQLPI
jgi:UDP-N-acetylglucosamine 2-epimerase (non-hydrolysing)